MKKLLFISMVLLTNSLYALDFVISSTIDDFSIEQTQSGYQIVPLLDKYVLLEDVSKPMLPYLYVNVVLPTCSNVAELQYESINKKTIPNIRRIVNNPPILPTDTFIENNEITQPSLSYGEKYPQENVSIVSINRYGDYSFATIRICPFIYYHDSCLNFIPEINVSIQEDTLAMIPKYQGRYNIDDFKKIVLNKEDIKESVSINTHNKSSDDIDYLIITVDSLKDAFLPLAHWKTLKGVKTKIITLEHIDSTYAGDTIQLKIKSCLSYYYYNHNLKWTLLGGDNTIVPAMGCFGIVNEGSSSEEKDFFIPCDLYYACFSGTFDWDADGDGIYGETTDGVVLIPDIYLSRLPIRNTIHVNNYIQKLLRYEQTAPQTNYVKRMLFCGTMLWNSYANGLSDAQLKSEKLYNEYVLPYWNGTKYKFYDTDTDFGGASYDLIPFNIDTQLNSGYQFLHYAAHGAPQLITTETSNYTQINASNLINKSTPLVIATMACNTNRFDDSNDPCLSEAFVRNLNGGAICYWGSSRYGWGYIDSNASYISLGPSFMYDAYLYEDLFNLHKYHFAELAASAKSHRISYSLNNGSWRWLQYAINPIGDPELPIYTNDPTPFSNIDIRRIGDSLVITTNVEDCTIAVTSGEDYGSSYFYVVHNTDSAIFLSVPQSYNVVVTKHNKIPYIYSSPLYIQNESYLIGTTNIKAQHVIAGENVTHIKPYGEVIVSSGGELIIKASRDVSLEGGFEVQLGGKLLIDTH